jgi:small subunit ribosomal protein S20
VANIKGQIKRNRTNEKRRLRNKAVRSELKTRVKTARVAVDHGETEATELVRTAQKRLDKAGSSGPIHRNAAARRVSRLMRRAARSGESG